MFPAVLNLNNLNGKNGFTVNLPSNSVAGIGDVNSDGFADIGIGYAGGVCVIYGSNQNWPASFDISSLNVNNGFCIDNLQGSSIAPAGDLNLDGIDDFMVGDRTQNVVFVVFGSKTNFPNPFNILTLNGQNGFAIQNVLGTGIASGNNINGNNNNYIIVPSTQQEAYVIYSSNSFITPFNPAILDGKKGFTIYNNNQYNSGSVYGAVGDFNKDGFSDIAVGFLSGNYYYANYCCITILFGSSSMNSVEYLGNQTSFFTCLSNPLDVETAVSVDGGKDLNGDNISDIALGCAGYSNEAGLITVYFGAKNITYVSASSITLTPKNPFDRLGTSVALVDDINGDTFPDLLMGGPSTSDPYAAVMYGHNISQPFPSTLSVAGFDGIIGFILNACTDCNLIGGQVSSAGDINHGNINDIIIAAPTGEFSTGTTYVVFGNSPNQPDSTPTDGSLSVGEIIGISVGAGVALLGTGLIWYGKTHGWCSGEHNHGGEYTAV
jgi:hypothetical protein